MTPGRLIRQSLRYHWRGNCALFLGVAVATAVLTGALLVGDSLRGSLRHQVNEQLGWIDHALISGRFIRAELANEIQADRLAPAILLRGAAIREDDRGETVSRAGRVTMVGVDSRFWDKSPVENDFWTTDRDEVVVNEALANALGAQAGDFITINVQKVSNVPRDSLLAHRDAVDVMDSWRLQIKEIIPNNGPGRFNLAPSTDVPLNAFVPLRALQQKLMAPKRRGDPGEQREPMINALLARAQRKIFNVFCTISFERRT